MRALMGVACVGLMAVVAWGVVLRVGEAADGPPEDVRKKADEHLLAGRFRWTATGPLISPADRADDPCRAVKDPSVVRANDRWHVFSTIRSQKRTHQIEYESFADWKDADAAPRHVLRLTDGYFCAAGLLFHPAQEVVPRLPG